MPFVGEVFTRAIASPDGLQARASSGRNVHCQTGESGRIDCVEYRPNGPLRPGGPTPVGADPYASQGANTNATATQATVAVEVGAAPSEWQAPLPLPPAPVR
jgi:hypothetical protein